MSYSTPTNLYLRIGPRIALGLTAEPPDVAPDDDIAQASLTNAMLEIDARVGHRTQADAVALLAGLEEQIALWFLYVYRGFSESETAAAAAKVGYDAAIRLLESGDLNLPPEDPTAVGAGGWASNVPVYTATRHRAF